MLWWQSLLKRMFDVGVAFLALSLLWPLILVAWCVAAKETGGGGFFIHNRIGREGKIIRVIKIQTMFPASGARSSITSESANAVTRSGFFMRKYKIDELPQLWNVLLGDMSLVGPRPDVPGYADRLVGEDRLILKLRPGITGPASLKYRNEEELLGQVENPKWYNDNVIWPDKVRINLAYYRNYSFLSDLAFLRQTLFK